MGILAWLFGVRANTPGVYRIRNRKNGMVYIGSTQRTIRLRLEEHVSRLHAGTHPNPLLQADWDVYGHRSFAFEVMENTDASHAEERELYWQLRVPRSVLYSRLADPVSARAQRKIQQEQKVADLIDALVRSQLTDDDLHRLFKAHIGAEVKAARLRLGIETAPRELVVNHDRRIPFDTEQPA